MSSYNVIGIMSGTSLDGLDIAFCKLGKDRNKWNYSVVAAETISYSQEIKKLLSDCQYSSGNHLLEINNLYGKYIADAINEFLSKRNIKADLIASHGHTIFHQPEKNLTYQVGNGAVIACHTGITTIADFRIQDVANGGQGAPLVPVGDEILFGEYSACLNLGGFSNISYNRKSQRIAFDICPVNIVLNYLAGFEGKEMDENGKIASSGKIIESLFNELESLDYYKKQPPKSLGKEWVEKNIFPLVKKQKYATNDLIRTFTEHVSLRISEAFSEIKKGEILVTGGGAFNKFLIQKITEKSKNVIIKLPEKIVINYKEALIFALLGVLRYRDEINCFSSVTGAKSDSSTGVVFLIK